MKTILLILFGMSGIIGCSKKTMGVQNHLQSADTSKSVTNKGSFQYLALGDSYTIGESVSQSQSFPYQLKAALVQQGYPIADPKIIAVTGWTTGDLKDAIAQANITQKYSFVTLLIGVNNQYRGYSQSDYRTEFVQLLNTAIAFAGGNKQKVFVISIPDYSVTPFAQGSDIKKIATEIDQFNAINKDESTKASVNYVNITDISRQAVTNPALVAFDGLHPSAQMYNLWVSRLAPMVAARLK
jgi:lysophospholipase L1-like esterase